MNRYHSAWCTTYQVSTFYDPIFMFLARREDSAWCKTYHDSTFMFLATREGEERKREREKSLLLCTIVFFLSSRVYCHVILQRVLFSHKKLERVVQEPDLFWAPLNLGCPILQQNIEIILRPILFSLISVFTWYFILIYGKWSCKARADRKKVYIAKDKYFLKLSCQISLSS